MADMLKFRKGLYANLPSTKTAGTVYITTDEKAMYVDISATERIRIGDLIRVQKVSDIPKPYSETALYYVEGENALLGYKNGEWKQINGIGELESRVNAAEDAIDAIESALGENDKTDGSTAFSRITALEGTVGEHDTAIENLQKAIGADADGLASKVAANSEAIEGLTDDLDALELEVLGANGEGGIKGTLAEHTSSISTINSTLGNKADKSYVDNNFLTKTNASTTYATKDELNSAKSALQSEIDADVKVESERAVAAESALSGRIKTLEDAGYQNADQVGDAIDTKIAAAKVVSDKYTDDAVAGLKTEVGKTYATKAELEATDAVVSGHTNSIKTINETLTSKANVSYVDDTFVKKADADAKLAKIDTTKTVSEAIADAVAAEATTARAAEKANADAISALSGELANVKNTADAAVTDEDLANAIKNFATTSYVDQAETDAVKESTRLGNLAYAPISLVETVAGHTTSIGVLTGAGEGSVADAKKAGTDAQTTINNYVTAHQNDYTNAKINELVADAKKAGTDAQTTANANGEAITALKSTVNKLDGDVNTAGSVKKQIKDATDALETSLTNKIEEEINAANAMEYQGEVANQTALDAIDKTKLKAGDTFVVTSAFGNYKPGDLLIATGTETNGVITSNFSWTHVKTGYDASLEQVLSGADNKIKLSSVSGGTKGEIEFAIDVNVTGVTVDNNKVTVGTGIEWGTF